MIWLLACTTPAPIGPDADSGKSEESDETGVETGDVNHPPDRAAPPLTAAEGAPLPAADASPADCTIGVDYDDDADGVVDRWARITYDEAGQWVTEDLDDGTYVGTFTALWEDGCLVRSEGALVDDDGDDWAVTQTQDCDSHGAVTRKTEVWAETPQGGGTVVYGDTTRWTWTWADERYLAVNWTSNDGETNHTQAWTWSHDLGPDSSTVDLLSDGVIDTTYAWTWDDAGERVTETEDGSWTEWTRDYRRRITNINYQSGEFDIWRYRGISADHPYVVESWRPEDTTPTATVAYAWDCA